MAAEQAKERGNRAFAAGLFSQAAAEFSEAIALHSRAPVAPSNVHVYHSNRSAALLKLGDGPGALADAEACVALRPDWPKGYSRQGAALYQLGRFADARRAYQAGLTRDASNPALREGLQAVNARLAAGGSAGGPASTPTPTTLRGFLVGDAGAAFRTFQAGLRALLVALFVLYWLGSRGAFGSFFLLALLHYASFLAFTHGRPRLDAAYGQRLVLDPATQSLFFALVFWAAAQPPHGLAMLPVLLIEAVHLCKWLGTLLELLGLANSPVVAAITSRALVPLASAVISEPGLAGMTPAAKWAALYRKTPGVAANVEVALGLALVLELLSPARNVLLVVLYWQVLRVRYMISPPLQDAFRRLHAALLTATSHPRCPAVVGRAYAKLHAFAWKMVEVNTQQGAGANGAGAATGAAGLASRCVVM